MTALMAREVEAVLTPAQRDLTGMTEKPDVVAIVTKTAELVVRKTIDIPCIRVVPKGEVTTGFNPFKLDTAAVNYQPVERDILIQHLRTHQQEILDAQDYAEPEKRLEDYIVRALADCDDISYENHAGLLYDLAGQMVAHLRSYLTQEDAVRNVLQYYQRPLAEFIHSQMQQHYWEKVAGYDVVVSKGFTALKSSAYTTTGNAALDFRQTVADRNKIGQLLFGGFQRCLYSVQKFHSDSERKLAIILDRDSEKWLRPASGQFQMFYKLDGEHHEYQPDFVAETGDVIYILESKARNQLEDVEVQAKKDSAVQWCKNASNHVTRHGGKPWQYLLIPDDAIAENMSLAGLAAQFRVS
jgi:type III restriction enzyme